MAIRQHEPELNLPVSRKGHQVNYSDKVCGTHKLSAADREVLPLPECGKYPKKDTGNTINTFANVGVAR